MEIMGNGGESLGSSRADLNAAEWLFLRRAGARGPAPPGAEPPC